MRLSDSTVCKIKDFINKRVEDYHSNRSDIIVGAVVGVIYGRRNIAEAVRRVTGCEGEGAYDIHPTEYFVLYVYTGGSCAMWPAGESEGSFDEGISPEIVEAIKNNDSRVMDTTKIYNTSFKSIDIFRRNKS